MREQQEWESTEINDNQIVATNRRPTDLKKAASVRLQMRTMQCLYYETTGTISVLQALQCTDRKSSWYY